jgi:hypothetical protein
MSRAGPYGESTGQALLTTLDIVGGAILTTRENGGLAFLMSTWRVQSTSTMNMHVGVRRGVRRAAALSLHAAAHEATQELPTAVNADASPLFLVASST